MSAPVTTPLSAITIPLPIMEQSTDFEPTEADLELFRAMSDLLDAEAGGTAGSLDDDADGVMMQAAKEASDAAFGDLQLFLNEPPEDMQAKALSGRGSRRKLNRRKQSLVAVLKGLPSAPTTTLLERLALPQVSDACHAFATSFRRDAASSDAAMTVKQEACSTLPSPIFCRCVMISTMTLGLTLGADAAAMMSTMLIASSHGGKNCTSTSSSKTRGRGNSSMRDRLEALLTSPVARAAAEEIFGRPWAITHAEKDALRYSSKQDRKSVGKMGTSSVVNAGMSAADAAEAGKTRKRKQTTAAASAAASEGEDDGSGVTGAGDERVFANAVIIMIRDSVEANIKSCKVFTSGVLHITGCLSIDEGLRVAGAVGQVVRMAFGLPNNGPHPVESVDVQMINTDFSLDISIDRLALQSVISSVPPPRPCTAKIPPTKHASIKLQVAGIKHGTVLVFTTGKIMMTGFKNWLDLRKAFEYTVDVITQNADQVRSEIKQQARVNHNTNRGRSNRNVGVNSPIMRLLPAPSIML